ncbi:hypothetical protein GEV33_006822 [Tenebrio molitor]|uniref:Endonuclease/exonuclease/phosphatase domain-containing protein n=1 Tax=Tenebrio molitor TaxID=7067 RepID=A0A8J6HJT5_TENMO|nr:hypothetical protein GEV33_006822 [Tenebrio molitor]
MIPKPGKDLGRRRVPPSDELLPLIVEGLRKAAGSKNATKSFADTAASKKHAGPAQTPRPTTAQKNSTAEKIITEVLLAIRTSTSTEQILAQVKSQQITFFNARSLGTTRNELDVFADSQDLDVILVNQTFLHAGDTDPKIRGYVLYRNDRNDGAGGGTATYVGRTLPHYPNALPALRNLEATAVTIETANGPLTLISCYHKPQDQLQENDITILDTGASVIATEPTYYDTRGYRANIIDIALTKNVPFQIRLHVSIVLNSDHMPVLMHIGDEANGANSNITCSRGQNQNCHDRLNSNSNRAATKKNFATTDRRSNSPKKSCQAPFGLAILPLSVPMEKRDTHFYPKAREGFQTSPKLSPHQSPVKH